MSGSDNPPKIDSFDQFLVLNAGTYEQDFLPMYQQLGISPNRILQIPLILPFHIPFRWGTCLTFALEGARACTLAFRSVSSVQEVHAGIVSDASIAVPQHRSRVEMIYVTEDGANAAADEAALSDIFDLLLTKLNAVIAAYVVLSKDRQVYRVSREMFEFGSVFRSIAPGEWEKGASGLLLLHFDVPFEKPEMSREQHEQVVRYAHVVEQQLNPFILAEELSVAARRELLSGGYREAIIFAQTAVETMLGTLLSHAMRAEGHSDSEIEQQMQEVGLATRLKREYHPRFGGTWSVDRRGTPVGDWFANTYRLRNRIVHAGYAPSFFETSAALEAAAKMISFVVTRVRTVEERYPALQPFFEDPPPWDIAAQDA